MNEFGYGQEEEEGGESVIPEPMEADPLPTHQVLLSSPLYLSEEDESLIQDYLVDCMNMIHNKGNKVQRFDYFLFTQIKMPGNNAISPCALASQENYRELINSGRFDTSLDPFIVPVGQKAGGKSKPKLFDLLHDIRIWKQVLYCQAVMSVEDEFGKTLALAWRKELMGVELHDKRFMDFIESLLFKPLRS